ncbi:MAG: GyrI-like domain-containing protein [Bacteroidota bacterium]
MEKIDLKKTLGTYKAKINKPELITAAAMNYLMIDGKGDPNHSKDFQDAIETLYSVAYTLKFMVKKGLIGVDYGVMPLEALWWADDMNDFTAGKKENWHWTAMILQPDIITNDLYREAKILAVSRKELVAIDQLRFEQFKEGTCAQVLYIGPYCKEKETIISLHNFIKDQGYQLTGKHHEIYLNDARRTAEAKLKTIIRQQVTKKK